MKIIRFLLIIFVQVFLGFMLLFLRGLEASLQNISDHLFVIGIVFGMPSLVAFTESFKIFYGFRYAFRVFISPNYRKTYPTFKDYKDSKKELEKKSTFFIEFFFASLIIVFISGVLSEVVMNGLQ